MYPRRPCHAMRCVLAILEGQRCTIALQAGALYHSPSGSGGAVPQRHRGTNSISAPHPHATMPPPHPTLANSRSDLRQPLNPPTGPAPSHGRRERHMTNKSHSCQACPPTASTGPQGRMATPWETSLEELFHTGDVAPHPHPHAHPHHKPHPSRSPFRPRPCHAPPPTHTHAPNGIGPETLDTALAHAIMITAWQSLSLGPRWLTLFEPATPRASEVILLQRKP